MQKLNFEFLKKQTNENGCILIFKITSENSMVQDDTTLINDIIPQKEKMRLKDKLGGSLYKKFMIHLKKFLEDNK